MLSHKTTPFRSAASSLESAVFLLYKAFDFIYVFFVYFHNS